MTRPNKIAKSAISLALALFLSIGCISAEAFAGMRSAWGEEALASTEAMPNESDNSANAATSFTSDDISGKAENETAPHAASQTNAINRTAVKGATIESASPDAIPDDTEKPDDPAQTPKPGWLLEDNAWYYIGTDGQHCTGWQLLQGNWYWLAPARQGRMSTGLFTDSNGETYYANDKGVMQRNGWVQARGGWYWLSASGATKTGWLSSKGSWYWLDPTEEGRMATGWQPIHGEWYYLTGTGAMATGWRKVNGSWYWLKDSGAMATGWRKVNGSWYWLKDSGAMATGWLQQGRTWYYLTGSGAMATGSHLIDGKINYFNPNGVWQGVDHTAELFTKWAQPESSATNWLILVDTARCKVGIFWGSKGNWKLQRMMDCAPGKSSTPTVKGRFTVKSKGYYFDSGAARCFYFTQFYGNYLFHSVLYYQTSRPTSIMDGRVGMGLSHGCVRLRLENAKWIYDNIPRGTKVYIW